MSATPAAKQQFVIVRNVAASSERVFEALVSTAGMKGWIPLCQSAVWQHAPGARGPGVGSVRVITLAGGIVAPEKIVYWKAGRQMNYAFVPPTPLEKVTRHYEGVTSVEPTGTNSSRLTWAIHFDAPGALAVLAPVVRISLHGFIALMAARLARIAEA